jgi:hypothetical protein
MLTFRSKFWLCWLFPNKCKSVKNSVGAKLGYDTRVVNSWTSFNRFEIIPYIFIKWKKYWNVGRASLLGRIAHYTNWDGKLLFPHYGFWGAPYEKTKIPHVCNICYEECPRPKSRMCKNVGFSTCSRNNTLQKHPTLFLHMLPM